MSDYMEMLERLVGKGERCDRCEALLPKCDCEEVYAEKLPAPNPDKLDGGYLDSLRQALNSRRI